MKMGNTMEVAVLGGGHGCYAAAAELSELGHNVRFWRRDASAFGPVLESGCITLRDYKGTRDVRIARPTTSLAEAIKSAEAIVIPLPATAHERLAETLAPLLEEGQIVFLPPGSFGSYIFLRALRNVGNQADVSVAETGTLPYLARKHSVNEVVVSAYAKRLPTGVFPARNSSHAFSRLKRLYPAIEEIEDGLSAALMNAGPIIHPPLIMMNAGPLEHFGQWDIHNEGTQPSIRRVTDALDAERIALRERLDYRPPHFPLSDHYAKEGPEWMYGRGAHDKLTASADWRERIDLTRHRYMLEDTRIGLSLLVSIGRWARVSTPVAEGFLTIASAITGRNLYTEGRTLENLDLSSLSRNQMMDLLQNGI
jgi:opine dehydrogenase